MIRVMPRQPVRAVQYTGTNKEEIQEFVTALGFDVVASGDVHAPGCWKLGLLVDVGTALRETGFVKDAYDKHGTTAFQLKMTEGEWLVENPLQNDMVEYLSGLVETNRIIHMTDRDFREHYAQLG